MFLAAIALHMALANFNLQKYDAHSSASRSAII